MKLVANNKLVVITLIFIILSLFIPIPYVVRGSDCVCKMGTNCGCPKEGGIGWHPPLIMQLILLKNTQNNQRDIDGRTLPPKALSN